MPIYEYACTACGAECEMLQRISDDPARTCPECGAEALVKQVSAAGFRLKGGGWYETDFKSDGKRNLVGDDSSSSAGETKSASSDDKPAAKTETVADKPAKAAAGDSKSTTPAAPAKAPKASPAAPSGA